VKNGTGARNRIGGTNVRGRGLKIKMVTQDFAFMAISTVMTAYYIVSIPPIVSSKRTP
jgi:hypothetical protein